MIFGFVVMIGLLAIGVPVVFVLGITATLVLVLTTDVPLVLVAHRFFTGLESFPIMAIPFFILAGVLMEAGGLSKRIVDFSAALVGWITGSLLMVSVVAAAGLAAMSGSGSADTAAISAIMQPELKKRRYDIDFSAALIACAGTLAQVIPPSLMMVLIAVINDLSVGALFLAGVVPGLLIVPGLLLIAYVHARRGGPQYREIQPFELKRLGRTFVHAIPALFMAFIIMGGILGGVFTPTEAAAVAAFYAFLVGWLVYRDLRLRDLPDITVRAAGFSCGLLVLVAMGDILNWLIANAEVPRLLAAWIKTVVDQPWTFLLLINVLLMLICMIAESIPMLLILSPVLLPVALSYGIDPIHFALVMVMNIAIGTITPPIGGVVFVAATVAERTILGVSRKLFWPWCAMTAILLLVTYVPELGLALPRAAGFVK